MTYNITDASKPFDLDISKIVVQIWNDPVVSKLLDEQSSKFYFMDSAS